MQARSLLQAMDRTEPYVAFSLLTQRELDTLGTQLSVVYEIGDTREFDALLSAIDEAEARADKRRVTLDS